MEARAAFGGASISKWFVAVVLVIVAAGLGVMGAYAVKGLGGSAAATTTQTFVHPAPATSLRQDNDYPQRPAAAARALPIRHS